MNQQPKSCPFARAARHNLLALQAFKEVAARIQSAGLDSTLILEAIALQKQVAEKALEAIKVLENLQNKTFSVND